MKAVSEVTFCIKCGRETPHFFGKCFITVAWYIVFAIVGLAIGLVIEK